MKSVKWYGEKSFFTDQHGCPLLDFVIFVSSRGKKILFFMSVISIERGKHGTLCNHSLEF